MLEILAQGGEKGETLGVDEESGARLLAHAIAFRSTVSSRQGILK